jgi:hypothetical protein
VAIKSSGVRITDDSSIQTQDMPLGKKYPRYVPDDINRAEKHKQYFSLDNMLRLLTLSQAKGRCYR